MDSINGDSKLGYGSITETFPGGGRGRMPSGMSVWSGFSYCRDQLP